MKPQDSNSGAPPERMALWLRAAAWLLFLGPFFFGSYGFANWLASQRAGVPQIVFAWERSIPFVPWTIIPYWSIDLMYGLSLFLCTTRRELDRHALRLFAVQIICVFFFVATPLRFSFDRPAADGLAGALFTALAGFDKPFNQAPSLHIALLLLIWVVFARHTPRALRPLLHGWMVLIGASVLTTYQHHFIDIPTGFAAGAVVLWAIPDGLPSPLRSFALTKDAARLRLAAFYALGAIIFTAIAFAGGWWLWSSWVAAALALVALNYIALGATGFQKLSDGSMSIAARFLFAPYLFGAFVNSRIWTRRRRSAHVPAQRLSLSANHVVDNVWIGRIPSRQELKSFGAIVDLAAELPCPIPPNGKYTNVPVLDLTIPSEQDLTLAAAAIERSHAHGPVLVCCALGYSRSASAIVAWLLQTKRARSVPEAQNVIRQVRPSIVLTPRHSEALEIFA